MVKKLLLLFIVCSAIPACSPEIKNDTRVLVEGKVLNEAGKPLANIPVWSKADHFLLGKTKTDPQGNFKFTSLESTAKDYTIVVNELLKYKQFNQEEFTPMSDSGDTLYTEASYSYKKSEFQKTYSLPPLTLKKSATLNLSIKKNTTTEETLTWSLTMPHPNCRYNFDDDEFTEYDAYCYSLFDYHKHLGPNRPEFEKKFRSVLNTKATFKYSINGGEEKTIVIYLSKPSTDYAFEY